jgi:hypothetical protein
MARPNINGKNGGVILHPGFGVDSYFALSVGNLPASVKITVVSKAVPPTATWDAVEADRKPHHSRHILVVKATQTSRPRPGFVPGTTDDITVTVTNTAMATETDNADLDAVFR